MKRIADSEKDVYYDKMNEFWENLSSSLEKVMDNNGMKYGIYIDDSNTDGNKGYFYVAYIHSNKRSDYGVLRANLHIEHEGDTPYYLISFDTLAVVRSFDNQNLFSALVQTIKTFEEEFEDSLESAAKKLADTIFKKTAKYLAG